MPRKKSPDGPPGAPEWMVTFSDIMSLLVTFFVMLMTFSSFDRHRYDPMAGAMAGAFGVIRKPREDDNTSIVALERIVLVRRTYQSGSETQPDAEPLYEVNRKLIEHLELLDLLKFVDLIQMDRRLVIRVQDGVLFEPGSARLTTTSRMVLGAVKRALRFIGNHVVVEGHADDGFKRTKAHVNAREMSLARAVVVADELLGGKGLAPYRIGTAGAGLDKPVLPNTTAEGRAANRRVEITILPPPPKNGDE